MFWNYNFNTFLNLQSGSIFIELVDIAAGSVLIPLLFEIESVLEEIVFDVERMLVTPPHETTVGDDVVDWLTSIARKLFNCVIRLAFCFWSNSHFFL